MDERRTNSRYKTMLTWLATVLPNRQDAPVAASSDASFRRYWRVTAGESPKNYIIMDAPPTQEAIEPFLRIAKLLWTHGVNVPQCFAFDAQHGFVLLSDLGQYTYLDVLCGQTTTPEYQGHLLSFSPPPKKTVGKNDKGELNYAHRLYRDAIGALITMQKIHPIRDLPRYSKALLIKELRLFPVWYAHNWLGAGLSPAEQRQFAEISAQLVEAAWQQPPTFVHRDYHSRNLMVCPGGPGVLDFQDAVLGPITYDLVSLFRDAYIEWDEALESEWVYTYWYRAQSVGLPIKENFAEFYRDYEWLGVQRQLKVLGIFARLWQRDGKANYLPDMPRVHRYLCRTCARYEALQPLLPILERLYRLAKTTNAYTATAVGLAP